MVTGISNILTMPRSSLEVPQTIPAMELWFRSDLGVSTSGASVTAWANQSGHVGRDVSQGTPANQPTLVAGVANGQPGLLFDNSNDFLTGTLPSVSSPDLTLVVVSRQHSTGNHCAFDMSKNTNTNNGIQMLHETSGGPGQAQKFRSSNTGSISPAEYTYTTLNVPQVHIGTLKGPTVAGPQILYEKTTLKHQINSVQVQAGLFTNFRIGALLQTGTFPWDGYIFEIIWYSGVVTAPQLQALSDYAVARYGIA